MLAPTVLMRPERSDGFTGGRLAAEVAAELRAMGWTASTRELPPYPSHTPETGSAVFVEIAGRARPLALAETWRVAAYPPLTLPRSKWEWLPTRPAVPPRAIAEGLGGIARSWESTPEQIGVLDVLFAALEGLPPVEGGWRALLLERVWIGVERGLDRGPDVARIEIEGHDIVLSWGTREPARRPLRTRADLDRALPELAAGAAAYLEEVDAFLDRRRRLEAFVERLCVELGTRHLPPVGAWRLDPERGFQSSLARPRAWLRWGGDGYGSAFDVSDDSEDAVRIDGVAFPRGTPLAAIADHVAAQSRRAPDFWLRNGARYRLKKPLHGLEAGAVVHYRALTGTTPNWDYEEFVSGEGKTLALGGPSSPDGDVLGHLEDWFQPLDDYWALLAPEKATERRIASLVAISRELLTHGAFEAAEARRQEASTLDPGRSAPIWTRSEEG